MNSILHSLAEMVRAVQLGRSIELRVLRGVLSLITATACAADAQIPLSIQYPRPLAQGTPKPTRIANLEPEQVAEPRLLVPAAVKLLSRGRPVTASDMLPIIGELSFVTDGDKSGTDGTILELGPQHQWVQIDLGAAAKVYAIAVWHYHSEKRVYHDVAVQLSNDPEFKRGVITLYDNASAAPNRGADRPYLETKYGRLVDGKGTPARYVRLSSNGNTSDEMNHYCEVEVYGVSAAGAGP